MRAAPTIRGLSRCGVPQPQHRKLLRRTFPALLHRGLGNTDIDLNASQPVSLVYEDVVLENPDS
jgi:iron complex outermembrane receptor protein